MSKNILTFFSLCALSITGFAQIDTSSLTSRRWSVGLSYNSVEGQMNQFLLNTWQVPIANYYDVLGNKRDRSYSISVITKCRFKKNVAFRFECGLTAINLIKDYNAIGDTISQGQGQMFGLDNYTKHTLVKQNIIRIIPAIEYDFNLTNRLHAHLGSQLVFNYYLPLFWSDSVIVNDTPGRSAYYESKTPGGIACGIGFYGGVSILLSKSFSLGCEASTSVVYYAIGGKQEGIMNVYYPNSNAVNLTWTIDNNRSTGIQFTKIIPSICFAFHI